MNGIAILPGTFDPFTKSHLDIAKRAIKIFDSLIILIGENINKNHWIKLQDRKKLIQECISLEMPENKHKIQVSSISKKLTINYCLENNVKFIVRGIRGMEDTEHELKMAYANSLLDASGDIQTIFLFVTPQHQFISSSLVKEIIHNNGDISQFVPSNIKAYIENEKK